MSLIRLQYSNRGVWEDVKISKIEMSDDETVVLGGSFRILVDGEEIYMEGKKLMRGIKTRVERLEKTLDQLLVALEDSQLRLKLNQKVVDVKQ